MAWWFSWQAWQLDDNTCTTIRCDAVISIHIWPGVFRCAHEKWDAAMNTTYQNFKLWQEIFIFIFYVFLAVLLWSNSVNLLMPIIYFPTKINSNCVKRITAIQIHCRSYKPGCKFRESWILRWNLRFYIKKHLDTYLNTLERKKNRLTESQSKTLKFRPCYLTLFCRLFT